MSQSSLKRGSAFFYTPVTAETSVTRVAILFEARLRLLRRAAKARSAAQTKSQSSLKRGSAFFEELESVDSIPTAESQSSLKRGSAFFFFSRGAGSQSRRKVAILFEARLRLLPTEPASDGHAAAVAILFEARLRLLPSTPARATGSSSGVAILFEARLRLLRR